MPHLLLTQAPKVEGAALQEKKTHKRKVSGGEDLLKGFLHVHESCQQYGATPRRYMAFLNTYKSIYSAKKEGVEKRQQHLQVCHIPLLYKAIFKTEMYVKLIPYHIKTDTSLK